ncbi:MAG: MCE family protein [Phycisphaerales bacterium]|nr:MAG: MCE family protein [Phycisphaerales bacterium]
MSEARRNVTVGIFVLVGILMLAMLIIWFGEQPDWLKRMAGGGVYPLHISFRDLSDVEPGTEVRMAVGTVGRVTNVSYRNPLQPGEGIDVVAEIREHIRIPSNAIAVVQPGTMFNRSFILLSYPRVAAEPVPTDGSGQILGQIAGILDNIIPKTMLVELEKATVAIGNLADGLTPVAHDLHELIDRRPIEWVDQPPPGMADVSANLYTATARLDRVLKSLNEIVGDPETRSRLLEGIANLHQMSEDGQIALQQFREFSKELRGIGDDARAALMRIDTTFENADNNLVRLSRDLIEVTDQLSTVLTHLEQAGASLTEGEGTAAMFLTDRRLYEEMVISFQRLTLAIDDLQSLIKDVQDRGLKTRF